MAKLSWKDDGKCVDMDVDIFFEKYEEDLGLRAAIDRMCSGCPIAKECLQWGISHEEWGVWGGIYLEAGQKSEEFNEHKTTEVWDELLLQLTHDTGQGYE